MFKRVTGHHVVSIVVLLGKKETSTGRHALIMDEVDGMAGNEDRGGVQVCVPLFVSIMVGHFFHDVKYHTP